MSVTRSGTGRLTDRQIDRQTDRQMDRKGFKHLTSVNHIEISEHEVN